MRFEGYRRTPVYVVPAPGFTVPCENVTKYVEPPVRPVNVAST